jgi:hypothetical protein
MKSAEPLVPAVKDHTGAGGTGVSADSAPAAPTDPYALLVELLVVVEELCPSWPPRDTFAGSRIFRL